MPTPQAPLLLADNVFDRINLYANAVLGSSATIIGREVQYAADCRRERSYCQFSVSQANNFISSDLGAGVTKTVDSIWIDRGHNLWGKTIQVVGDDGAGGSVSTAATIVVPASGTVGGDPTTGFSVTEEGAVYALFATSAARRRWIIYVVDNWQPVITGVILGSRAQLLNFSSKRDEDAGGRIERTVESDAGYLAVDRVYSWRTCDLALDLIGATEYDSTIRTLRQQLFERNQPTVIIMNYGDKPERGWLFQYQGKSWGSPMTRVHRKWSGTFREVYAVVR
jgi:hypothetical protein